MPCSTAHGNRSRYDQQRNTEEYEGGSVDDGDSLSSTPLDDRRWVVEANQYEAKPASAGMALPFS